MRANPGCGSREHPANRETDGGSAELLPGTDAAPRTEGTIAEPVSGKVHHLGDAAGAVEALDRAREAAPESATVAFNRALALLRTGREEEARKEFRRGRRLDPERADALAGGEPWRSLDR